MAARRSRAPRRSTSRDPPGAASRRRWRIAAGRGGSGRRLHVEASRGRSRRRPATPPAGRAGPRRDDGSARPAGNAPARWRRVSRSARRRTRRVSAEAARGLPGRRRPRPQSTRRGAGSAAGRGAARPPTRRSRGFKFPRPQGRPLPTAGAARRRTGRTRPSEGRWRRPARRSMSRPLVRATSSTSTRRTRREQPGVEEPVRSAIMLSASRSVIRWIASRRSGRPPRGRWERRPVRRARDEAPDAERPFGRNARIASAPGTTSRFWHREGRVVGEHGDHRSTSPRPTRRRSARRARAGPRRRASAGRLLAALRQPAVSLARAGARCSPTRPPSRAARRPRAPRSRAPAQDRRAGWAAGAGAPR